MAAGRKLKTKIAQPKPLSVRFIGLDEQKAEAIVFLLAQKKITAEEAYKQLVGNMPKDTSRKELSTILESPKHKINDDTQRTMVKGFLASEYKEYGAWFFSRIYPLAAQRVADDTPKAQVTENREFKASL